MSDILSQARNMQAEALFASWNLPWTLVEVPLEEIRTDPTQQVRDTEHIASKVMVEEYLAQMKAGALFPPVVLRSPGAIMVDGNTRCEVRRRLELTTTPAYLVEIPSGDLARALGAQLNQMGGVRLTQEEATRAALNMLTNLRFTDAQVAQAVGRSSQQVKAWRLAAEAREHAEKLGVDIDAVAPSQHKVLAQVVMDEPFRQVVDLAATRKVPYDELSRIVKEMKGAPSEADAVAVVDRARMDLRPTGPAGAAVTVNLKAKRMRMVLPQVLNLAPPLDVFDPAKAAEDRRVWLQVREICERMLVMYDEMGASSPGADEAAAS